MRDLDHALTLIEATVGAVDVPVTLKMRLGWDDATLNAPELARRAEDAGVAADHRARPHALPVLQRHGRLGRDPRRQGGRLDPGRRQRRPRVSRRAVEALLAVRRRRRDDRARRLRAPWFPGQLAHYLRDRASGVPTRRSRSSCELICRALRSDARPLRRAHRRAPCAQASRLVSRCGGGNRGRRAA